MKLSVILIIIFLLRINLSSAQANDSNIIAWSQDYRLTYDDFKAKPGSGAKVALTNSGFYFLYEYDGGENLKIELNAMFDKSKSWFKENGKTPDVLMHEQTHFDITELYVRKFRKFLLEKQFNRRINFDALLPRYYNDYINKCSRAQHDYDIETSHGTKEPAQKAWEKKVAQQLDEMSQYNKAAVRFRVK